MLTGAAMIKCERLDAVGVTPLRNALETADAARDAWNAALFNRPQGAVVVRVSAIGEPLSTRGLVAGQASGAVDPVVACGQEPQGVQADGYPEAEVVFQGGDGGTVRTGAERSVGVGRVVLEPAGDAVPGVGDLPFGDRVGGRVSGLALGLLPALGVSSGLGEGNRVHVPDLDPVGPGGVADGQGGAVPGWGSPRTRRRRPSP